MAGLLDRIRSELYQRLDRGLPCLAPDSFCSPDGLDLSV